MHRARLAARAHHSNLEALASVTTRAVDLEGVTPLGASVAIHHYEQ